MKILDFVPNDGYSEKGFVKGIKNIHGDFRFEFRPMLLEQRLELYKGVEKVPADVFERKAADYIAKNHLISWSLVDGEGKPVNVSPKAILRLKQQLWQSIYNIICGFKASDSDPTWTNEEVSEYDSIIYESAITGESVGEVAEVKHLKN